MVAATVTAGRAGSDPARDRGGRAAGARARGPGAVRAGRRGGDESDGGLVVEGGGRHGRSPGGSGWWPGPRIVPHPIRRRSRRPAARRGRRRPDRPHRRSRARRPAPPAGRDDPVPALSPAPSGGAEPSSPAPRTPPAPGRGGPPGRLAAPGLSDQDRSAGPRRCGRSGRAGSSSPAGVGERGRPTSRASPSSPRLPMASAGRPGRVVRSIESAWTASCRWRRGPPGAGRRGRRGQGSIAAPAAVPSRATVRRASGWRGTVPPAARTGGSSRAAGRAPAAAASQWCWASPPSSGAAGTAPARAAGAIDSSPWRIRQGGHPPRCDRTIKTLGRVERAGVVGVEMVDGEPAAGPDLLAPEGGLLDGMDLAPGAGGEDGHLLRVPAEDPGHLAGGHGLDVREPQGGAGPFGEGGQGTPGDVVLEGGQDDLPVRPEPGEQRGRRIGRWAPPGGPGPLEGGLTDASQEVGTECDAAGLALFSSRRECREDPGESFDDRQFGIGREARCHAGESPGRGVVAQVEDPEGQAVAGARRLARGSGHHRRSRHQGVRPCSPFPSPGGIRGRVGKPAPTVWNRRLSFPP